MSPATLSFSTLPYALAVAVLLSTAAAVLLLYLLRPPARRQLVSSILLWEEVARRRRRKRDLLRWLLSLLMSAAIALLIGMAFTGAQRAAPELTRPRLVIDTSATMGARSGERQTRLDRALSTARRLIRNAAPPITISDTTGGVNSGELRSRRAALEKLDELELHAARPPRIPGSSSDGRPLWVVTDGVADLGAPDGAAIVSVFEPEPNVGLTRFAVTQRRARQPAALLEVTNAGPREAAVEVAVSDQEGRVFARQTLSLEAGELWSATVRLEPLPTLEAQWFRATVTSPDDALDLDDQAWVVTQALLPRRLQVHGVCEPIDRVVAADPTLTALRPGTDLDANRYEVDVWHHDAPVERPDGPTLLVNPPDRPWLPVEQAAAPATFAETSWALPGVAPRHVAFEALRRYSVPQAETLWTGEGVALLFVLGSEAEPPRIAVLSFDPETSSVHLDAQFPALVELALDALSLTVAKPPREAGWSGYADDEADRPQLIKLSHSQGRAEISAIEPLGAEVTDINRRRTEATTASPAAAAWSPEVVLVLLALALLAVEFALRQRGYLE